MERKAVKNLRVSQVEEESFHDANWRSIIERAQKRLKTDVRVKSLYIFTRFLVPTSNYSERFFRLRIRFQ